MDLKSIVEEGIKREELIYIGRINPAHNFDLEVFNRTRKNSSYYFGFIMVPITTKDGYRYNGIIDLYALKPKKQRT